MSLRATAAAALFLSALLAGCAASGKRAGSRQPTVTVDSIVIRNELAYAVTDVMVEVPETRAFAGCGTVLPNSECSNRFEQRAYRGNAVRVGWQEHGQPHGTGEFVVEPPEGMQPGRPLRIEVVIFAPGEAGARLVQP